MIDTDILDTLIAYATSRLQSGEWDRPSDYLSSRHVTSCQVNRFDIGYIPPSFDMSDLNVDHTFQLKQLGNWSNWGGHLQDKLVFPVTDPIGTNLGIHVRTPSHDDKDYMKFYLHRSEAWPRFFGIGPAMESIWSTGSVWLCEGLFDIFPIQRHIPHVICTLTAGLQNKQFDFLKRHVNRITLAFDNDDQGDSFCQEFMSRYGHMFESVKRFRFKGKDVSDCFDEIDESRFESLVNDQRSSSLF